MRETAEKRAWRSAAVLALPFCGAAYYTWKMDALDRSGLLASGSPFSLEDLWIIAALTAAALPLFGKALFYGASQSFRPGRGRLPPLWAGTVFLFLLWLPVLLVFYPAAGMNDTVYMMENPLKGSIQFPWGPTLFWGAGARLAERLTGSREPFIFAAVLWQMLLMATGLSWGAREAARLAGHPRAAWVLLLYFAFFPMCGNYAAAAVRDPLYSLALLGWTVILSRAALSGKGSSLFLTASCLAALMLLRSNGIYVSLVLAGALMILVKREAKKTALLFLVCAAAAVLPGKAILHSIGEEPLFQETAAVPLQQAGRVLVTGGAMDEEMKELLTSYLPEERWKKGYSPYTVDFIKWDPAFRHDRMTETKTAFLAGWIRTGLSNPGTYLAGWMTETYALWNLDPLEHQVQSRFGWALTDENTAHMEPADNDRLAAGPLPLPSWIKSALVWYSFEGSRFLGAGLSLWITFFIGAFFYVRGEKRLILCCLPLWANGATLLVSTPASAVFRYSFAFVLILPVLVLLAAGSMGNADGKDSHQEDGKQ